MNSSRFIAILFIYLASALVIFGVVDTLDGGGNMATLTWPLLAIAAVFVAKEWVK